MTTRTGLPDLEVAVLRAVQDATADAPDVRTHDVLAGLDRDGLVGPRAARTILGDLILPWRRHLPLVRGVGNRGGRSGDRPADPEVTEIGLTEVGALALAHWAPATHW